MTSKYVRFLPIAQAFAEMSKYPRTKVGALVLGPRFEIRSTGWNGVPRGSRADEDDRLHERATALDWTCHAEANAIANAAACGARLEGCTLVVTHMPCMSCAKLIVQAGIVQIVTQRPDAEFSARWGDDMRNALRLFGEVGVRVLFGALPS